MDDINVIKVDVKYSYNGSSVVVNPVKSVGMTATSVLAGPKGETGPEGPEGPAGTTDYNELDNLPTLGTAAAKDIPATGNASATEVVYGTDTRLTDSRPASDVSAWAKAPTKPTYTNTEVGAAATVHTHAISDTTGLQTSLDGKVDENAAITGATKTKITYDAKGLVTAGADATTADIADSTDKRYVTDAQKTVIGNTSGTNTGDNLIIGTSAPTPEAGGKVLWLDTTGGNITLNLVTGD